MKWTIIAGIVNETLVMSVRNLGYSRNAGEFVRKWFADIGSAGGHRAMAKAVVPVAAFREKFGDLSGPALSEKILDLTPSVPARAPAAGAPAGHGQDRLTG